ncbi:MAG: hypothetical protein ABIV10_05425 [Gemmatimonadaceae bacterium]
MPAPRAEQELHAGARHVDPNVTESPDWPTTYHPPGVIRLVTPAEEAVLLRRRRLALVPSHPDGLHTR